MGSPLCGSGLPKAVAKALQSNRITSAQSHHMPSCDEQHCRRLSQVAGVAAAVGIPVLVAGLVEEPVQHRGEVVWLRQPRRQRAALVGEACSGAAPAVRLGDRREGEAWQDYRIEGCSAA